MPEQPHLLAPEELDAALFGKLGPRRQKLAMVAAGVMMENRKRVTESMIDDAFARLAQRSDVETFGDILSWRFSEICLRSAE